LDTIYVWLEDKNYENVVATCPFCNHRNTFNRATDLKKLTLIIDEEVHCQNESCQKPFRIVGDIANPSFELLIFDCYKLKAEKRYSYCILNLAQSFEMFFALYLRVEILYKPFAQEGMHDQARLKRATDNLAKKTKELTFSGMRAFFLNHIVLSRALMKRNAASLDESEIILAQLTSNMPNQKTLSQVDDPTLMQWLLKVSETKIGEIRNKVVHKSGYRPSLAVVEAAISETEEILNGLRSALGPLTDRQFRYRIDDGK
jgi:hypothetical protein